MPRCRGRGGHNNNNNNNLQRTKKDACSVDISVGKSFPVDGVVGVVDNDNDKCCSAANLDKSLRDDGAAAAAIIVIYLFIK